ncbi:hypothetical protein B5M09_003172 [Aphanomyces astaci]|uniref:Rab3 GTPase-activating protein catalytic subunit n=1 Tax=Aphanomyces astaci TaxID=112090 RepID=A0A425CZJ5_APHAT|nr:hypothetical protein B5M09_003172 [Aphanomyces astaci]
MKNFSFSRMTMADVEEDPSSRFVDYTNETDWERFIAAVEDALLQWGLNDHGAMPEGVTSDKFKVFGLQNSHYLLRLHQEDVLHAAPPPAAITIRNAAAASSSTSTLHYTPTLASIADPRLDLTSPPESLHRYFGCDTYLLLYRYHLLAYNDTEDTITLDTTAGVRDDEVHVLLSSLMVALGNCNCTLPAFVVVGDLDNQRFMGVAAPGLHSSISMQFDTNKVPEVRRRHLSNAWTDSFLVLVGARGPALHQRPPRSLSVQAGADPFIQQQHLSCIILGLGGVPLRLASAAAATRFVLGTVDISILAMFNSTLQLEWRHAADGNHQHHDLWKYMTWGPVKSPLVSLALQAGWTSLQEGS